MKAPVLQRGSFCVQFTHRIIANEVDLL